MTRFEQILRRDGEDVTWYKRSLGAMPDPETGDFPVSWTTETIKAIVQQTRVDEVFVEAGYTIEDHIRVFVTADIKHLDRITYRNVQYEILQPEAFYFRGTLEYRTALCRRLIV